MDELRERAIQYNEGMLTSREFLGQVIDILGQQWQGMPEDICNDDMANKLANLLVQP